MRITAGGPNRNVFLVLFFFSGRAYILALTSIVWARMYQRLVGLFVLCGWELMYISCKKVY